METDFLHGTSSASTAGGSSSFGYDPFYSQPSSSHHQFGDDGSHGLRQQSIPSHSTPSSSASSSARASSEAQQDYVPTYSEAFPPLPDQLPSGGSSAASGLPVMPPHYIQQSQAAARMQQRQKQPMPVQARAPGSAWPPKGTAQQYANTNGSAASNGRGVGKGAQQPVTKSLASSKRTETIVVPLEERRMLGSTASRPSEVAASERDACSKIREETGVDVEVEVTGNNGLRIMLYGREANLGQARLLVKKRLLTEGSAIVHIPKEHHKMLLGKKGDRLNDIQRRTGTKINIPQMKDESDEIKIIGSRDCIAEARRELLSISDMESKRGFERLVIPKIYHPFIRGARNSTVDAMHQRYPNVKINMPPPSNESEELTIVGDKDSVQAVKNEIERIYKTAESTSGTLSVQIPAERHKYLLSSKGETLHQILAQTGVTVQLPPKADGSHNVILRGDQSKLGAAVSMLIDKANSIQMRELPCPGWLQPRLIGRGGQTIKEMNERYPEVHVAFEGDENKIRIEGAQQQVEMLFQELTLLVAEMQRTLTFQNVPLAKPELVRHIIGKAGANVKRLRQDYDVQIHIPPEDGKSGDSNVIRVEGNKNGVDAAVKDLKEIIRRIENETTKDISIDHRLHRVMIGQKGDKIDEIRAKFQDVNINFPDSNLKSNTVQLRGPREEVEKCSKYMLNQAKLVAETNHQVEVPVFPAIVPKIIGKGGANITKIRQETDTRIDMPAEGSGSGSGETSVIRITGTKANVEKARKLIQAIQDEQANLIEVTVNIPHKLHNELIGPKGSRIRAITQDCGNVHIKFPDSENQSDTVTVRGPKADVEKAKRKLLEIAEERELTGYTHELKVKPDLHRFVIGTNGANINRVREQYQVQVAIPSRTEDNSDTIVIIGRKENVEKAREDIEKLVTEMADMTEEHVSVPREYQSYLRSRANQLYREVEAKFASVAGGIGGGITIQQPRRNNFDRNNKNNSDNAGNGAPADQQQQHEGVLVRGAKDAVEYAKKRIAELIEKWQQFTTDTVSIPPEFQSQVIGQRGQNVDEICKKYDVQVKFPERVYHEDDQRGGGSYRGGRGGGRGGARNASGRSNNNAEFVTESTDAEQQQQPAETHVHENNLQETANELASVVRITGTPEAIELAKQALLALIPVTKQIQVPFKYHRLLIGTKGAKLQELQKAHNVNVRVPRQELNSDTVEIIGLQSNIDQAQAEIQKFLDEAEKNNYSVQLDVPQQYHQRIIGSRGATINQLREKFGVNITVPRESGNNMVTITGPEESAHKARDEITQLVNAFANEVKYEVDVDPRVHRRIIGSGGTGLRKLMKDFGVDIKFPRFDSDDLPDKIYVTGVEENVTKCVEELSRLEEEYMESARESDARPPRGAGGGFGVRGGDREGIERGGRGGGRGGRGGSRGGGGGGGGDRGGSGDNHQARGFAVREAPWQSGDVPNASSFEDFPSFSGVKKEAGGLSSDLLSQQEVGDGDAKTIVTETTITSVVETSGIASNEDGKN